MIENADLDEAEQKRRKQQQIEWRTKKRFSGIFMTIATICEILITLIIFIVLFLGSVIIATKVFGADLNSKVGSSVYAVFLLLFFFGSLFLGFLVYKKCVNAVIKRYHLEDKLSDEIISHYQTKEEAEKSNQNKRSR